MTILTVAELAQHIEHDLSDVALQRLADAAEELINRTDGGPSAVTEYFDSWGFENGYSKELFVRRPINTIDSITERVSPEDTGTVLSSDDYSQQGQRKVVRLSNGTNPRYRWAQHVEVTYTPDVDTALRKKAQIDLVKLSIIFSGAQREKIGDFDFWHFEQDAAVKAALKPLVSGGRGMVLR